MLLTVHLLCTVVFEVTINVFLLLLSMIFFLMVKQRYLYIQLDWLHDMNALLTFISNGISKREQNDVPFQ